jgi:hypothetical protein
LNTCSWAQAVERGACRGGAFFASVTDGITGDRTARSAWSRLRKPRPRPTVRSGHSRPPAPNEPSSCGRFRVSGRNARVSRCYRSCRRLGRPCPLPVIRAGSAASIGASSAGRDRCISTLVLRRLACTRRGRPGSAAGPAVTTLPGVSSSRARSIPVSGRSSHPSCSPPHQLRRKRLRPGSTRRRTRSGSLG